MYWFIITWTFLGSLAATASIFSMTLLYSKDSEFKSLLSNLISGLLFGGYQYFSIRNYFTRSYWWFIATIVGYIFAFLISYFLKSFLFVTSLYFLTSLPLASFSIIFLYSRYDFTKIIIWFSAYYLFLVTSPNLFAYGYELFNPKSVFLYSFLHFVPLQFALGILFYKLFLKRVNERCC